MKKLFLTILFILLPVSIWGATIYVKDDPNNSGTKICIKSGGWADGTCSDGTANTTGTAAVTAAGAGGTVIFAGGYGYIPAQLGQPLTVSAAGVTIRAATSSDSGATNWNAAYAGTVTFNGNNVSAHVISLGADNTVIQSIAFTQPANIYASIWLNTTVNGTVVNDCSFTRSNGGATSSILRDNCGAACTITLNRISHSGAFPTMGVTTTNLNPKWNYGVFNYGNIGGSSSFNGSATFNNITFINSQAQIFATSANNLGATVTWNNCIFWGIGDSATYVLRMNHDQTWTCNNCIAIGPAYAQDNTNYLNVTMNNSYRYSLPKFVSDRYPAVATFAMDDIGSVAQFRDTVGPALVSYGWRGTINVNYTSDKYSYGIHDVTKTWVADLLALEAAGHEIGIHTRDHSDITQTTAFNITGAAGETASCNGTTLTTTGGGGRSYTLANYTTLTALRTALSNDGYTVGAMNGGLNMGNVPAWVLDDFTDQSIAAAFMLPISTSRYWTEEITGSYNDLVAIGLHPSTFTAPGDATNAALQAWLQATGTITGARGTGVTGTLASSNVYGISLVNINNVGDTNACEATGETRINCIKRNTAGTIGRMVETGGIFVWYFHTAGGLSEAEWVAMLDTFAESSVQVMTMAALSNYVKTYDPNGDLATTDNLTYTRTLTDASDYHLQKGSPAINAGVNICTGADAPLTGCTGAGTGIYTDYAGVTVPIGAAPDIGAYEQDYIPSAFSFTDITGATPSTVYASSPIVVAGIDAGGSAISIAGGTYSINGGAYTADAGVVALDDSVAVRVTSSPNPLTAVNAELSIGGVSDTYTVTTKAASSRKMKIISPMGVF